MSIDQSFEEEHPNTLKTENINKIIDGMKWKRDSSAKNNTED